MATRGGVARLTGPGKFVGVYHHWDSYPEGLGSTLFGIYREHFDGNLKGMLAEIIDAHPEGWSTLNGDWSKGAIDTRKKERASTTLPEYYSPTEDRAFEVTHETASGSGCEYIYAFDEEANKMVVLSSYCADGVKMVGMFGFGDEGATWRPIAVVDLHEDAPDWTNIEGHGIEEAPTPEPAPKVETSYDLTWNGALDAVLDKVETIRKDHESDVNNLDQVLAFMMVEGFVKELRR